ncbi:MAG: hypothetical protein FGM22_08245 [Burkholderiaceae bacterium]|nr:hypothetical protein [Burkholderiaceae bacterium]
MKIQLCIIAGNEEPVISRFLSSFQPHVDGVTVCMARGNQAPDATEEICRSAGCSVVHYENAPEADWPHVDNFAAARNVAWQAVPEDTDWLMWADCDDMLGETGAAVLAGIRAGEVPEADAIMAPYIVDAQGGKADRLRLVRRWLGSRWINAVHEDLQLPEGEPVAYCPELQVIHVPLTNKLGSTDRNRRILRHIPAESRTGREWWFLSREAEMMGAVPEALEAAVVAATREDLGDPEKFSCFLSIGRWLKEPEHAERPLLEAARLDPYRREPYAELARMHLARGDAKKALGWARIMDGIRAPEVPAWNADLALASWKGNDILWHAMSANGIDPTPQRKAWRKENGVRISIIHPTCRPEQALKTRQLWFERAVHPHSIEHIFGINEADAPGALVHYPHAWSDAVPPGHSSAVANYNAAAAAATGPIIIAAQDDIYPPMGWDEGVWRLLSPHTAQAKVLHLHDGFREDRLMVIMCVTRAWLKKHGTLLCPEYDGYYSDTEYSYRAYEAGEVIDGSAIRFYHDHPVFTGAASDEAYMRQQNPVAYARGKEIFERRNPGAVGW